MANIIGCTQANYSCYENGARVPPLKVLSGILDYYHVSINELLDSNYEEECDVDDEYSIDTLARVKKSLNLDLISKLNNPIQITI